MLNLDKICLKTILGAVGVFRKLSKIATSLIIHNPSKTPVQLVSSSSSMSLRCFEPYCLQNKKRFSWRSSASLIWRLTPKSMRTSSSDFEARFFTSVRVKKWSYKPFGGYPNNLASPYFGSPNSIIREMMFVFTSSLTTLFRVTLWPFWFALCL